MGGMQMWLWHLEMQKMFKNSNLQKWANNLILNLRLYKTKFWSVGNYKWDIIILKYFFLVFYKIFQFCSNLNLPGSQERLAHMALSSSDPSPQSSSPSQRHEWEMHSLLLLHMNSQVPLQFFSSDPSGQSWSPSHFHSLRHKLGLYHLLFHKGIDLRRTWECKSP